MKYRPGPWLPPVPIRDRRVSVQIRWSAVYPHPYCLAFSEPAWAVVGIEVQPIFVQSPHRRGFNIAIQVYSTLVPNRITSNPPAEGRRIIAIADVIIFRFGIIPVAAINDAVRPVIGLHIIIREPGAIRTRTGASPEILFSVNAAICSLKLLGRLLEYIHCTATPQTVVCRASGRGNELLRWTVDDSSNKSNGQNLIPLNISAGRRQSAIRRHPARLHFARTISPSPALRQSAPPV